MSPTTVLEQPTIAIIGAGISGLALAIGLARRGVRYTVYDAGEKFSTAGAGIGLGPNALAAMDLLDPSFRNKYDEVKTANQKSLFKNSLFDALYAEEGFGEKRGWTGGSVGAPYFERSSAHRKALLDMMGMLIPPDTVRFSKRAEDIMQANGKVTVRFSDGQTITVDALLGADGVHGPTRKLVLASTAPHLVAPVYSGIYAYRGILPMKDAEALLGKHGEDAKWFMGKGKGLAIYPISKGTEETFIFFVSDKQTTWPHSGDGKIAWSKEAMLADLQGFDQRLLSLLDWASPLKWPVFHHPVTPTYYHGRICLLGDVAHASTPHQAAGAGQGLEDALVLAHLLARVKSSEHVEAVFRIYDGIRRPRAQKVVATSREAGYLYLFQDPEAREDMQTIVDNANQRFHWIWQHDMQADLARADEEFKAHLGGKADGEPGNGSVKHHL